jgi:hypothetical protein
VALSDPLQWIIIGVCALGVLGLFVFLMFRLFQTFDKVNRYLDGEEKEPKQPT